MEMEATKIGCRICLKDDEPDSKKCLSLFEYYGDCVIADKVNAIANVGIKQNDGLPDRICPDCLLQLENAVAFKRKCEESDDILHNRVVQSNESNTVIKEEYETFIYDGAHSDVDDVKPDSDVFDEVPLTTERPIYTNGPVECDDCGGTFKTKCKLRVHWKKVHLPDKLICLKCKRTFKSYKSLNRHIRIKSLTCYAVSKTNIEGKGKSRVYNCPYCDYKTTHSHNVESHIARHTGEKRMKCDKCPATFIQRNSLNDHKEKLHKEYLFETTCQYCGDYIKGRRRWYIHMRRHLEAKITCQVCKKVLKNKRTYQEHMKRHSGVKAYPCDLCSETFYTKSDMSSHKLKDHIKKVFNCDICGYTLNTVTALKRHKSKHTPINAVCLTCGAFVETPDKLVAHQRIHNERNYHCPLCEKTFFRAKSRGHHVQRKHGCYISELNGKVRKSGKPNEPCIKKKKLMQGVTKEVRLKAPN